MDVPGQFLSAANNLDYNKTNQLIDVALKEYLGSDSVVMGLSDYLKKFGIYDDIINMYDDDIIKLVIKNRCKIDDTLKTWGI